MAYPTTVYIYQPDNNPDAPWVATFDLSSIPDGIKFAVYTYNHKGKSRHTVTEAADE